MNEIAYTLNNELARERVNTWRREAQVPRERRVNVRHLLRRTAR